MAKSDIVRYAGDTYPNSIVLKVNGVPIHLSSDWDYELRYKDGDQIRVIDCVIADAENGILYIYPHSRLETDPKLFPNDFNDNNKCWTKAGEYPYRLLRKKNFNGYVEQMTHLVGIIKILEAI